MSREDEVAKYEKCYQSPDYRMGERRKSHVAMILLETERGSLLDVGCGRGEVLEMARRLQFFPVWGVDPVGYLCDEKRKIVQGMAHDIPFDDKSFDIVTMFDVIEHLLPDDTEQVCRELQRVAKREILLTVHNGSSCHQGVELHINRKSSYEAWFQFFKQTFHGTVEWLPRHGSISEMFRVTLHG
jgi:ubiquinone/menaquinone biosynthesis C-methylase UbiE